MSTTGTVTLGVTTFSESSKSRRIPIVSITTHLSPVRVPTHRRGYQVGDRLFPDYPDHSGRKRPPANLHSH
ncbi:hypothetical protein F4559_006068 [Saccharothrix violaceirubra]|uniref:Uncharacterized protein n=1 Tax=Saccharothrix violaceirubra TaxID=413306 RepID=A0A7W7T8V9_9PSEU|nr:hypothetical protein [Saccharothrix violaceirubra]